MRSARLLESEAICTAIASNSHKPKQVCVAATYVTSMCWGGDVSLGMWRRMCKHFRTSVHMDPQMTMQQKELGGVDLELSARYLILSLSLVGLGRALCCSLALAFAFDRRLALALALGLSLQVLFFLL